MIDSTHIFDANTNVAWVSGTTKTALTETLLVAANQQLYTDGGEATLLMIKPGDATKIAGFVNTAADRTRYVDNDAKKLVNVIEVYVSPFGTQKVVLNRFISVSTALLFDPSYWKKATLRPWHRIDLAKTGDSDKAELLGEYSLIHTNFKASMLLMNLS